MRRGRKETIERNWRTVGQGRGKEGKELWCDDLREFCKKYGKDVWREDGDKHVHKE